MSALTPASEVILRHEDTFITRHVLFAGDLQDTLPCQLETASVRVHTTQYHHWQMFQRALGESAHFGLLAEASFVQSCDTLIFYWPKSKPEAQFQLQQLFSVLPENCDIFIVGENRSGVRSVEHLLSPFSPMNKIDTARRCSLYHASIEKRPVFNLEAWWQRYTLDDVTVNTLPGVFSSDALDNGSQLLLSTFDTPPEGEVLDIGCGAGVLATILAKHSNGLSITLSDVNAAALASSHKTLESNKLQGTVVASNVYSDIQGRFDLIISNPPFHDGLNTSLQAAESLIKDSVKHLKSGGELRLVANAFLPYPEWLDKTFGSHQILAQTGRFKVYQAKFTPGARR